MGTVGDEDPRARLRTDSSREWPGTVGPMLVEQV